MTTIVDQLKSHIDAAANGRPPDLEAWKAEAGVILRLAVGADDPLVSQLNHVRYTLAAVSNVTPPSAYDNARVRGVQKAVAILKAAITQVNLTEQIYGQSVGGPVLSNRTEVFIVHGHDDGLKETVARFLSKLIKAEPVILHEQVSGGDTIIEKLERFAASAKYAVVLATGDDLGRAKAAADSLPRARQNVIFELGYFFAALGRSNVALLYDPGVERPSDTDGIVHIPIDTGGAWKIQLAREIEAAGFEVDRTAL